MSPDLDSLADAGGSLPSLSVLTAPDRLAAVDRVIAQGSSGPALERLTALAARLMLTPYAQINLVADQQVVAAVHGAELSVSEKVIDLRDSVCAASVAVGGPLIIEDAQAHPWGSRLPTVSAGPVGSYLSVPLVNRAGQPLGTLCVYDAVPRRWTPRDVSRLSAVAEAVLAEFEHPTEVAPTGFLARAGRLAGGLWSAADVGSFDLEFGTGLIYCDDRLATFLDLPVGGLGYPLSTLLDQVHPDDLDRVDRALAGARARGGEFQVDHRIVPSTGELRWLSVHGVVLPDIVGRSVRLIGRASDTTVVRNDRDEMARVLETSTGAFFRLDREQRFTYLNNDGERMLGHRRDELLGAQVRSACPEPFGVTFQAHCDRALALGEPVSFESRWPALDSWIEVRLWPDHAGLSVYLRDIGDRKSAELERERAAERLEVLEVLARASEALSASLDSDEVLAAAASFVVPAYGDWVWFTVREDLLNHQEGRPGQAGQVRVAAVFPPDRQAHPQLGGLILGRTSSTEAAVGPAAVIRTGQPEWLAEVPEAWLRAWADGDAELLARLRELDVRTALTLPLISRDRVLGAMTVLQPVTSPHVRSMLAELSSRSAAALDNALQYAAERRMGLDLQRSLLPGQVPTLPGISIATRYLPATEGALTGGDLHQVVVCADHLVLALGDVEGHGMTSAARMGQLRAAVAALALETYLPGHLLERLAANTDQLLDVSLATLLVASYSPTERVLKVASAGHPPAVVVRPGEPAFLVEVEPGPPLGVAASSYDELTLALPVGTLVVLYSDGLIERRDESLTRGLERLRLVVEQAAGHRDLELVADRILAAMGLAGGGDDDIALLLLRHP